MQSRTTIVAVAAILLAGGAVNADVFSMGGTRDPATGTWTGTASLETVLVGNPGNVADYRFTTAGYGTVAYEYRIGKYDVTAGQYTEFLNKVAKTDTYELYSTGMWSDPFNWGCKIQQSGSPGSYTYSVASDYANRPVNYVSWGDAARFANWLHNGQPTGAQGPGTTEDGAYYLNGATSDGDLLAVTRKATAKWAIPTDVEWYKAAYHRPGTTGYYEYATGSNTDPGRDMADPFGNNANYYTGTGPYGSPIDSGKYYTTVVGQFHNSPSLYGTFDQNGNVQEWTEAVLSGFHRGRRGGAFDTDNFWMGAEVQGEQWPSRAGGDMGFRVAEVPEPATLSLLALGGLALLKRRRK